MRDELLSPGIDREREREREKREREIGFKLFRGA
jgi:hypothetical protein